MSERELWRAIKELRNELDQLRAVSRITYAKSTYTPTYLGGTTAGTTTYTTQVGEYTRVGRCVFVMGRLVWTAATGTGNAQFSLPFTAVNRSNLFGSGSVDNTNVTFANGTPQVLTQPGTSFFLLRSPITNAASTVVQMEAAGAVNFSCWYEVI